MSARFDAWLAADGPVALTIMEPLEPVSGENTVVYPPTFAPPEDRKDDKPNYIIDENGTCLVDTPGSQANRLEPLFKRHKGLVPQFTVTVGERIIDLLDAGHRAADAVVRFSDKAAELKQAFLDYRDKHDATKLAKMAPTSLVFGAWDSRETQAKLPRLVESTVRAYNVERLTRSAQYFAALEKEEIEALKLSELGQKTLGELGILDSPSGRGPGGVIAKGGIRRDAVLNLTALRALAAGDNPEATLKLRRYILGLALVAFAAPAELYLRQGCLLVGSQAKPASTQVVWRSGKREDFNLSEQDVLQFAHAAAAEFGVGPNIQAKFLSDAVKAAKKRAARAAEA